MELYCYTIGQASQMLQISETTIRRRIKDGTIPRLKICGKILIPASFFEQLKEGGQTNNLLTADIKNIEIERKI